MIRHNLSTISIPPVYLTVPRAHWRRGPNGEPQLATGWRFELGDERIPNAEAGWLRTGNPEVILHGDDARDLVRWLRRLADSVEEHLAGLPPHRLTEGPDDEILEAPVMVHP